MGDRAKIDMYASRQFGAFNTRQVREAGYDRSAVYRRVSSGAWVNMAPGVYAIASSPPTWERQMSAAVLSCPRAVVAGTSAAYLHGLEGFGVSLPVIMVPWSGNARSPIARVIRSVFFQTVATDRRKGFLATTAAETVVTLAADLREHRLEAVLDDSLLTGRASIGEYEDILDRLEGSHVAGLGSLRPLIAERSPTASEVDSSYLERLLERVLADPRVPTSTREHPFQLHGSSARVDAYILEWGVVVEADGRRWHARQAEFESDRRRDNELAALGVQVLRFTYSMLRNEPERCLATMLEVGARRRATRRAERDPTHDRRPTHAHPTSSGISTSSVASPP